MGEDRRIYRIRPRGVTTESTERPAVRMTSQRPLPLRPSQPAKPLANKSASKAIEINLSLPSIRLPVQALGRTFRRWWAAVKSRKTILRLLASSVLVLVVAGAGWLWVRHRHQEGAQSTYSVSQAGSTQNQVSQTPTFNTLLPAGKTIDKLGGWGKVSPSGSAPAYAFSDMLSGIHIVVSEQQLPAGFSSNLSSQLNQVAQQLSGNIQKLTSTNGTLVFVGVGSNNAQAVVSAKKGLLLLARSSGTIGNQAWVNYIDQLQ